MSNVHVAYEGAVRDVKDACILDEPPKLCKQALNLLIGPCLGQGAYRRVYELRQNPNMVLKLEYSHDLQNAQEWMAWKELEHTPWGKWLAPCVSIDEYTGALIQMRAADLTDEQWAALQRYPNFLADAGRRNWGWFEGRPVMRDYGINQLMARGLHNVRMIGKDNRRVEDYGDE